jgi:hypothetical protein
MSPELEKLIEATRGIVMTPAQLAAQRRSFAFGNCNIENPLITRELIERVDREMSDKD